MLMMEVLIREDTEGVLMMEGDSTVDRGQRCALWSKPKPLPLPQFI